MTDYTDLIARLRERSETRFAVFGDGQLEDEAADAIAALQAEVARLQGELLMAYVDGPPSVVAHDDGSQTILDQSGNGRHWHIPAKE